MGSTDPKSFAKGVFCAIQDVLIHQRPKWSQLLLHNHQYEGWWKAELRSALDAFCWQAPFASRIGVRSEVKPVWYELGNGRGSFDLVVGEVDQSDRDPDFTADGPRVWIELKERGTWWGNAAKAFGEANSGLRSDLAKWKDVAWSERDVVAACQIISHRGKLEEPLPSDWREALEAIAHEHRRCVPTRSVGCPSWNNDEVLWATIEVFDIHGFA